MKKLIAVLLLISTAYAQTQIKYIDPITKDTVFTNYTITQAAPVVSATTIVHAYKAPVIVVPPVVPPPVTTPPVTNPGSILIGDKIKSGPVTLQSNKTYYGYTIDLGTTSNVAFKGNGVSNVTLRNCKILNGAAGSAVVLDNCSNVTIDSCYINGTGEGILVRTSTETKITNNQLENIVNSPTTTKHPIALQNCNGGGQRIVNNHIEEIATVAPYTHDQISIYNSNGLPGDSIIVAYNWIRGSQQFKNAAGNNGACMIGVGDSGGSFQSVHHNIGVNALAIAIDGSGKSLAIWGNKIYAKQVAPQSLGVGIVYFGTAGNNKVAYNQIKFITPTGGENDINTSMANGTISGLSTNILNAKIDASILPAKIITFQ